MANNELKFGIIYEKIVMQAGDNTEKNMGASVFGKARNDWNWGSGGGH